MITCAEAVQKLWQYLDETLEPDARDKVGEHLAFCRQCCGELEFAHVLQHFLRDSGSVEELPSEVRTRLERFVAELNP